MRRYGWLRAGLVLAVAAGAPPLVASGCSKDDEVVPAKGLMLALRTDMSIPQGVSSMRIEVLTNGVPKLANEYFLGPAPDKTSLPGTLALLPPSDPKLPVLIRVIARTEQGKAVVLREVTTTVPDDRLVMLPIGIQWLCWDSVVEDASNPTEPKFSNKECDPDKTCIAGSCQTKQVDSATLAPYDPTQIFGGAKAAGSKGQCFDTTTCFGGGVAETPDGSCTLAAPPAGQEDKYNVALVLPKGNTSGICSDTSCLVPLERDDQDGWKLEGGRVKLPPSVCQKLGNSIAAVATSTSCNTKTAGIPTCGPWSSVTSNAGTFDGGLELDASIDGDVSVDDGSADGGADVSLDSPGEAAQDATTEPPPVDPNLGRKCQTSTECGQLTCLTVSSTALGGEGPPGGMCTLSCTGKPPSWCSGIDPGSICQMFAPGAEYCLKGCAPGPGSSDAGFDPNKCYGRPDMGCTMLFSGGGPAPACMPTCAGTQHCALSGSTNPACNWATGLCTKAAPQAPAYGTTCMFGPSDGGPPVDASVLDGGGPQPCDGLCSPVPNPMTPGFPGAFVCSGGCVVNPDASCGWDGTGIAQAACMKGFVPNATDLGDLGSCVQLCSCQKPCSDPNMVCTPNPDPILQQKWGQVGYCTFMLGADGGLVGDLGC